MGEVVTDLRVERSLVGAAKVLTRPFGGGPRTRPAPRPRRGTRDARGGMGYGENTVRRRMGIRGGFREVQRLGLTGPIRQHPIQRLAIQIRHSLPRRVEEKLKKIYTNHIRPRD